MFTDGSAQSFESREVIVNDGPDRDRGSSVLTGSAWAVFTVFVAFAILVVTATGFVTFKKWSKGKTNLFLALILKYFGNNNDFFLPDILCRLQE